MAFAGCPLWTNEAIAALPIRDPNELSVHYLRYALMANTHEGNADAAVLGKLLNKKKVEQILIPVPPLAEQERIVKLLDEADAIRKLRAQADQRTADLIPALFHEMFGDPVTNPMGWPISLISSIVADLQGGKNVKPAGDGEERNGYRVLKVSAVTSGNFRPTESKPLPVGYEPPKTHILRSGDLLFSRANTTELVGATCYVEETPANMLLPDKLWRFVWQDATDVEPQYILSLMQHESTRRVLSRMASGSGGSMKNISKAKLLKFGVPVPPLSLQRNFVDSVAVFRSLQEMQQSADRASSATFEGILYQTFNSSH